MRSSQGKTRKRYQDGAERARRKTANFAMISAYRKAMRYVVVTGKTEKRYQDGAERGGKKDCKFCDDLDVSADNADIRSLRDKT